VEDRRIHFRLLHRTDRVPVVQRMVHPETGKPVAAEDIRKGAEISPGRFALLDDEAIEASKPEPSRTIEITRFLPSASIPGPWYDRPYFLGPDGPGGSYFALATVLADLDAEGIARWTMRDRSYAGALLAMEGHLALVTLRAEGEVIPTSSLEAPEGRDLTRKELDMAAQLVGMLESDFRPEDFRDEHRDRLRELIEARAAGSDFEIRKLRPRKPTRDLSQALAESLKGARKERRRAS
jgi:DNA end-binding protein Ku